jgi:hypothetical protein
MSDLNWNKLPWRKSSFSSDSANCVEVSWTRSSACHQGSCVEVGWTASSKCSGGDCVQVRHDDGVVYVRDSKLGDDSPVQEWPLTYWEFLCDAIVADLPRFSGYRKLDDGGVELRWAHIHPAPLIFDAGEWKAFVYGVRAGEFDGEKLSEGVSAGSGSVAGSGEAATGAVDGSGWSSDGPGSPVPVAAQKPLADAAWSREFLANAPAASADGSGLRPSPATGAGDGLRGGVPVPVAAELNPDVCDDCDCCWEPDCRHGCQRPNCPCYVAEITWSEDPSLGEPQGPSAGRPVDVSTDEVDLSSAVQPGSEDATGTEVPPDPVPAAPEEPPSRSLVLFERQVDMEVWFRDDAIAAEAFGSYDDERWFKCGDYDGDPMCWENVLAANKDVWPSLLTRSVVAPLVPAVETQETVS